MNTFLLLGELLVSLVGRDEAAVRQREGALSFALGPGGGDLGQLLGVVGVENILDAVPDERNNERWTSRTRRVVVERRGFCGRAGSDDVPGVVVEPAHDVVLVDGEEVVKEGLEGTGQDVGEGEGASKIGVVTEKVGKGSGGHREGRLRTVGRGLPSAAGIDEGEGGSELVR